MKATYKDHMGTDLSVVNAARVSFGKESNWVNVHAAFRDAGEWDIVKELSKGDKGLIQFLARGCTSGDWEDLVATATTERWEDHVEELLNHIRKMPPHWTPFAHTAITIHLKMPIFVARQIMKSTTGMVYNEVSRRYVDDEPEFYVPEVWRKRADNVKQGSGEGEVVMLCLHEDGSQARGLPAIADRSGTVKSSYRRAMFAMDELYQEMLRSDIAPEQARMVLPQSMYTEVIATGNLYSWANLYVQRTDAHAQRETQELAKQIGEICQPLFPVSWEALTQ